MHYHHPKRSIKSKHDSICPSLLLSHVFLCTVIQLAIVINTSFVLPFSVNEICFNVNIHLLYLLFKLSGLLFSFTILGEFFICDLCIANNKYYCDNTSFYRHMVWISFLNYRNFKNRNCIFRYSDYHFPHQTVVVRQIKQTVCINVRFS